MITVIRTDSVNADFLNLVKQLDAYLNQVDGEEHTFYNKLNTLGDIKQAVVAYEGGEPIGCGAIKHRSEKNAMEVKRMFTKPANRGKGVATKILHELEAWTKELGYDRCVLETGKRQPDAIALYQTCGYRVIPNYGQYVGIDNSVCFEKKLNC